MYKGDSVFSLRQASILITDVSGLVWFALAMVNCHRYFEHSRLHKLLHSCRVLCSLVWFNTTIHVDNSCQYWPWSILKFLSIDQCGFNAFLGKC